MGQLSKKKIGFVKKRAYVFSETSLLRKTFSAKITRKYIEFQVSTPKWHTTPNMSTTNTPNQKLTCFGMYFKIIKTVYFKKWFIYRRVYHIVTDNFIHLLHISEARLLNIECFGIKFYYFDFIFKTIYLPCIFRKFIFRWNYDHDMS